MKFDRPLGVFSIKTLYCFRDTKHSFLKHTISDDHSFTVKRIKASLFNAFITSKNVDLLFLESLITNNFIIMSK